MTTLWQKNISTKSGKELILRYPRLSDAEGLMHYINRIIDENVFILIQTHVTLENETEYVKQCIQAIEKKDAVYIYAVEGDQVVGAVDVRRERDKMSHVGLLGITISKEYRGQGLGKILIEEALRQAKSELGLRMVHLTCFAKNAPAIALYNKVGFTEYGRFPEALKKDDAYTDQVLMYKNLE